ncbi:MAG: NUDIX hydrolase [Patescibacteria group bacterium]
MIYKNPPAGFSPRFEIASCYLEHNGQFVLLHRHGNKSQANKWGVIAGKMEEGENVYDAMAREIKEETSINIPKEKLKYFTKLYVHHGGYDFVYHIFSNKLDIRPEIKINEKEHKSFKWVLPEEALRMDLVDDLDECIKLFYNVI